MREQKELPPDEATWIFVLLALSTVIFLNCGVSNPLEEKRDRQHVKQHDIYQINSQYHPSLHLR